MRSCPSVSGFPLGCGCRSPELDLHLNRARTKPEVSITFHCHILIILQKPTETLMTECSFLGFRTPSGAVGVPVAVWARSMITESAPLV